MGKVGKISLSLGMTRLSKCCCIFFALFLLLLSCEEKQECDAMCELQKMDFERLTTVVSFTVCKGRWVRGPGFPLTDVDIYKTQAGAIAKYRPWHSSEFMRIELSEEEWQSFVKSLYKYLNKDFGYKDWKNEYKKGEHYSIIFTQAFDVSYPNEFEPSKLREWKTGPSDWDGVEKLMSDMVAKIRERSAIPFEDELKAEYQKRFGEPISDFELSTRIVSFWTEKDSCHTFNNETVSVFKTESGAHAETCNIEVDISIGEWLDFVRALYKNGADRLEKKYGEPPSNDDWVIDIYSSGRLDMDRIEGFGAYPKNWVDIKKIMDDMAAKIKEKSNK